MSFAVRVSSLDHAPTVSATRLAGNKNDDVCCGNFPCCKVSHKALYLIAAAIWIAGVISCGVAAARDVKYAKQLGAKRGALLVVILTGIGCGMIFGHVLFSYVAKRSLDRIEMLEKTYWHSSFNWRFYLFLFVNIATINILKEYAWYDKVAYMFYATLELQVSVALFYSLYVFAFNWRTFGLKNRYATGLGEPLLYAGNDSDDEKNELSISDVAEHFANFADDSDPLSMKNILSGSTGVDKEVIPGE